MALVALCWILFSIVHSLILKVLQSPFWGDSWNAARLTPTLAIAHGYPLYAPADQGAILNTVYAPITALVYLPASLTDSITGAVMIGTAIAISFFLIPVLALIWSGDRHSLTANLLLFSAFCLFSLNSAALDFSGFSIHADAPALGFAACACLSIYGKGKKNFKAYLISATWAAAAVWTKQTMLPILLAIPFYLFLSQGRSQAISYLKYLGIALFLVSITLIIAFEPRAMFFNIITIPARHPWRSLNHLEILRSATTELIIACLIPIAVLACLAGINYWQNRKVPKLAESNRISNLRKWVNNHAWSLILIVAICLIPTSILGRVKIGGVVNTLSPTIYFLAIAAMLAVQELLIMFEQNSKQAFRLFKPGFLALVLAIALIQSQSFFNHPLQIFDLGRSLPQNPQAVAFRYAQAHLNQAYFPFNPLSSLMAEGKLYHFHYGIYDRQLAGYAPTLSHFQAHIPSDLKLVGFPPNFPSKDLRKSPPMQYLPQVSRQISLEELPGWTVFVP